MLDKDLDDILTMNHTLQELIFHRDIVIYHLQNLGTVLNLKRFVLDPFQTGSRISRGDNRP